MTPENPPRTDLGTQPAPITKAGQENPENKVLPMFLALDIERLSPSFIEQNWKQEAKKKTKVIEQDFFNKEEVETLNKTYFNAGRYSAGHRDKVALVAWLAIGEEPL